MKCLNGDIVYYLNQKDAKDSHDWGSGPAKLFLNENGSGCVLLLDASDGWENDYRIVLPANGPNNFSGKATGDGWSVEVRIVQEIDNEWSGLWIENGVRVRFEFLID